MNETKRGKTLHDARSCWNLKLTRNKTWLRFGKALLKFGATDISVRFTTNKTTLRLLFKLIGPMISMTRRNLNTKIETFIKAGNRNFFQKPPINLFISSRKSFRCIEPITFGQQILLSSCWGRIRTWTTQSAARWRCGSGWCLRCCRCCASG